MLLAAEASYDDFHARAGLPGTGLRPDASALLASARALAGRPADLVAIDMPLGHDPVVGRRESDNAISRTYGGRRAGTHTPNAERPGRISDELRAGFEAVGHRLCTTSLVRPGLIEVYPHPALIELTAAPMRLQYKAGKAAAYWPGVPPLERRARLFGIWAGIVAHLDRVIAGAGAALPLPGDGARGAALKAFEDKLDAVVCVFVAIRVLQGRARAYGDARAAIWVPC